uniref:Uncharacterized protein n=3 Tax=Caenorhabditis japonica TaxID=281687 RepID=A0A8R1IS25_CAEJA
MRVHHTVMFPHSPIISILVINMRNDATRRARSDEVNEEAPSCNRARHKHLSAARYFDPFVANQTITSLTTDNDLNHHHPRTLWVKVSRSAEHIPDVRSLIS